MKFRMIYCEAGNKLHPANVACEVRDMGTSKREISGLLNGKKLFPEARGSLILNDWQPELIPDNVNVIPAWKFLGEG